MGVKPTITTGDGRDAAEKKDLICAQTGRRHQWDYVRGTPGRDGQEGQVALYKCINCDFAVSKQQLKRLTDGGEL